jgi:acetyltransferase-like isoleucine patch superfamily enzyme
LSFVHRLRNWRNPHGETRLHLAPEIGRWGFAVGAYSYGRPKVRFAETGSRLSVGRYCSIADRVEIFLGGNHRTEWVTTYPFDNLPGLWKAQPPPGGSHATRGDVTIGNDVWIGSGAVILSGVTIGDGAVIGAQAVVSRDIPAYAVAAGNPAQVLRLRFEPAIVAGLLETAWWELPRAEVEGLIPLLQSPRVEELIASLRARRRDRGAHSAG